MPDRTLESDREGPAPIGTELAGLIDSIDLPIVVVDGNGTIAGFSAAASTLLALTLGDVGRPLRGVGTLAEAADLEELCAHVIGGGAACQREIRDSAGSWFLVRVAPYRRSDRYVAGAVLTLTNVTALHASVEQAIHEREYAKAIINTVSQPLVVLDGELRVRTANRAFYATFRVSRAETEGLPVDALGGGPIPRLRPLLEDVLASSTPFEGVEIEHDFPALGRRTMLFSACRLARTGDLGQPILLTIHDVTERKRAEEGLRESEQRARTLADEAQSANRVKDEFLATLSHELRTPLTAMLGWTRILRAKVLSDDAAERALETIERNVRAQTQLIEDLLDVSRILNGRLRLDGRRLDLRAVAEAALETIRPTAEAKRIQLGAAMDREGCAVWGDFGRLQQVVWNLLSNAVRFTPAGGRVEIVLERTASHATLVVADTGKGISPEFLPHVFEPFSQAESSAARRHGGLGLGLGIVRHLVELHGGTVHAESGGEGRGATFAVTLPLMLESVPSWWGEPEQESTNESVHGAEAMLGLAKLDEVRVLVVEDDADIRTLLDVVLSRCHAEVRVSSGAGEALAIVKSWQPDVLLADIGLPGEDGYSLLEKVRALSPEGGRRIPAAALTAYARVEDRERALTAGYDAYLAKPIEPSELVRLVRRLAPSAPREAGPVTPLRPRPG